MIGNEKLTVQFAGAGQNIAIFSPSTSTSDSYTNKEDRRPFHCFILTLYLQL